MKKFYCNVRYNEKYNIYMGLLWQVLRCKKSFVQDEERDNGRTKVNGECGILS